MRGGVSANAEPICSAQSQAPSSSLSNNTDVVRRFIDIFPAVIFIFSYSILFSGEILSNAHDVIITGGNYYSGHICIQHASSEGKYFIQPFVVANQILLLEFTESGQGIVPGLRVVCLEFPSSLGPLS
jgi:hypothetical protein